MSHYSVHFQKLIDVYTRGSRIYFLTTLWLTASCFFFWGKFRIHHLLSFIPSHILMHAELIPTFLTFSSLFSSLWTKLQSQPRENRVLCLILAFLLSGVFQNIHIISPSFLEAFYFPSFGNTISSWFTSSYHLPAIYHFMCWFCYARLLNVALVKLEL